MFVGLLQSLVYHKGILEETGAGVAMHRMALSLAIGLGVSISAASGDTEIHVYRGKAAPRRIELFAARVRKHRIVGEKEIMVALKRAVSFVFAAAMFCPISFGNVPPRGGGPMPSAYYQRLARQPQAFTYRRALMPLVQKVLAARLAQRSSPSATLSMMEALSGASASVPTSVQGVRYAPVLLLRFADTTGSPKGQPLYAPIALQQRLFGPSQSLTLSQFYKDMSNGRFTVRGTVYQWVNVPKPASYYVGKDYVENGAAQHCLGICDTANIGQLIQDALDANPNIDWGQYDNDGPDGIPNSGDDDGYVDFVAFVQPSTGAECNDGNANIWSHRNNLTSLAGHEYTTKTPAKRGGFIKIDDYTIQPAYSCDGADVNQIGVFAHEFGHTFGLPDLYDTKHNSDGIGNWCLMAGGAWGGDGNSPDHPVQMSAWAKEFLGWVEPSKIVGKDPNLTIQSYEDPASGQRDTRVFRYDISQNLYYLITNIERKLSDSKLPGSGVQVWLINQTVVTKGLVSNTVNADPYNKGVSLIEADGRNLLAGNSGFGGGPDDLFPGTMGYRNFDKTTNPASIGSFSLCKISDPGDMMHAIAHTKTTCSASAQSPIEGSSITNTPQGHSNSSNPGPTLSDLLSHPKQFDNREITLTGSITNIGSNLQLRSGRHIVFRDQAGKTVDITLPSATEIVPSANAGHPAPLSLPELLDQPVQVTAQVKIKPDGSPTLAVKEIKTSK